MIRKTLRQTQLATYSIDLPQAALHDFPSPTGTGFFISPDGWFVTAAHVISNPDGTTRADLGRGWLTKERRDPFEGSPMCEGITVEHLDSAHDFALLKIDFGRNSGKHHLRERSGFFHVEVSSRRLDEGEPVYAFGYPLPETRVVSSGESGMVVHTAIGPRVTSSIVASQIEKTKMVESSGEVQVYVLDKALNYGNSGGPIVATETGKVHAFCSRFQPLFVRQRDSQSIMVPSLYGIVVDLGSPDILRVLRERNISFTET